MRQRRMEEGKERRTFQGFVILLFSYLSRKRRKYEEKLGDNSAGDKSAVTSWPAAIRACPFLCFFMFSDFLT